MNDEMGKTRPTKNGHIGVMSTSQNYTMKVQQNYGRNW